MAHTIKGKGIPFTENDNSWHKRVPTKAELAAALKHLGTDMDKITAMDKIASTREAFIAGLMDVALT